MQNGNIGAARRPKVLTEGDRKRYSALLIGLVLAQPFLDTYYLYTDEVAAHTGGITLPPLLVILFTAAITMAYMIKYRGGRTGKTLLWYLGICAVYFVMHHISCASFNSFVPGNFNYSVTHEAYYVARLIVPMALIYLTWEVGFSPRDYLRTSCVLGAICGVLIVATNLLGVALCSYTNSPIYGSIFKWSQILTSEEMLPKYFASKAFFSYANQVSVVLTGLFPLLCYEMALKPRWYNAANAVVMVFAMLMLGTMTAAIGVILELCVLAVVFAVWVLYNRKKLGEYKKRIVALVLVGALLAGILAAFIPGSPAIRNMKVTQSVDISSKMERFSLNMSGSVMTDAQYKEYCTFVLYNYKAAGIAWAFVYVYYPYERDPAFWVAMIRNYKAGENQNYRSLETRVIQRVSQVDGSAWNKWLGISATRETNIVKIERDITAQYYSMGILGVILFFGAYFAVIIAAVAAILRSMIRKKKFPLLLVMLTMSFCVMMVMGYYCGNSLDMTFLSTYLGVSSGVLLIVSGVGGGAEAGAISKGFYYLKKLGLRQTVALVKTYREDNRRMSRFASEAQKLYPQQKDSVIESLSGKDVFVYTPSVEWHYLYQRCQQMASCLAARPDKMVLFLTTQRHYDNESGMTEIKPGLWLVNASLAGKINELACNADSVTSCVYNITSGLDCMKSYHSDRIVYEYVDDLRFIVSGASDFGAYEQLHRKLAARADLTVATAAKLYSEVSEFAKKAVLLPNAGDYDFFSKPSQPRPEIEQMLGGSKCVLEYYGALASWFDYNAVGESAQKHPDWAWLLVGNEIGEDLKKSGILKNKNVFHVPAVPYEELPSYIASADVMTIPFIINDTTLATSPVKLFEYMAARKPILTSELPECAGYESVRRYKSAAELDELVPELLRLGGSVEYLDALEREARRNTWDARVDEILRGLGM